MLIINAIYGLFPNICFIFLPFLRLVLILITLGISFLVSSPGVLIRDIPQLVFVFMQLFFFLAPVIYPIETLPERFRFRFVLNPVAAIIQAFRDIIIYQRMPDFVTLYYPAVFGGVYARSGMQPSSRLKTRWRIFYERLGIPLAMTETMSEVINVENLSKQSRPKVYGVSLRHETGVTLWHVLGRYDKND